MSGPFFSVVIPAHNRADLVKRALLSVLRQGFEDFEVILVDDASEEALEHLVSDINDPRFRFVRFAKNIGGAAARNAGIDAASGVYIAFLDSDDYWGENKLARCYDRLRTTGAPVLMHSTLIRKSGGRALQTRLDEAGKARFGSFLQYIVLGGALIQTSAVVVRRDVATRHKFSPSLRRHQDLDLYVKLSSYYGETVFVEHALSTWDVSHEQSSITREARVGESLEWISAVRGMVGDRVFYEFILRFIYARNVSALGGSDFLHVVSGYRRSHLSALSIVKWSAYKWARTVRHALGVN